MRYNNYSVSNVTATNIMHIDTLLLKICLKYFLWLRAIAHCCMQGPKNLHLIFCSVSNNNNKRIFVNEYKRI